MRCTALKSKNNHICALLSQGRTGHLTQRGGTCVSSLPTTQACCVLMMTPGVSSPSAFLCSALRHSTFHLAFLTPWGQALCLPLHIQSSWIPPTVLCPNPSWQRTQRNIKGPTVYIYIFIQWTQSSMLMGGDY